jgi:excisionase family DNA binding protein
MEREADTYSSSEAAQMLRKSNRHVLQMLESGELEGSKNESGRWRIPQQAVHELLPSKPPRGEGANVTSPVAQQRSRKPTTAPPRCS